MYRGGIPRTPGNLENNKITKFIMWNNSENISNILGMLKHYEHIKTLYIHLKHFEDV